MADQRPAFRFRLPWLPAAQPPHPTTAPRPPAQPTAATTQPQTTPQTTATQAPSQPPVTTTPQPTTPQTAATTQAPPPQPSVTIAPPPTTPQTAATQTPPQPSISTTPPPTTPQTAETQIPSQPSTTTTSAPTTQTAERAALTQPTITARPTQTPIPQTPERPPFRPPGEAPAQGPPPQSQTSRTESQPSSPSRAITQPRVPSQPVSPSRVATQSRAPSQPLTPPRAAPQERAVSVPSSPSRRSTQLSSTPRTATQPRSPSLASIQAGQTSSPLPPSSTTAQRQPTTAAAATQLTSPPKTEQSPTQKSSESSAGYTPKTAVPEDNIHDSQGRAPIKASVQPNEMTQQPSKESGMRAAEVFTTTEGPETPAVTQKSTTSPMNGKPESFSKDMKPEEPKEVKEVMQDIKDNAHDRARHIDSHLKGEQGQTLQTKDLSTIPFLSEQAQKTLAGKETIATSAYNGKQTKIPTTHPRNKPMLVDSQQKHVKSSGDHMPLQKEIRDDISKFVNKMAIGDSKHSIDDRPVSVITLAGENRGASMHVGFDSSKKEGSIHIRRGYKIKPDDNAEATTDGEESLKEQSDNPNAKEDQAPESYVNSNVQGINNSILFNASITERNPGVHLIHSSFPIESKKPSQKPEFIETRKAEFNVTPSQKLTHEPTVRRRCLRGLFLESSDSDLDAAKPRRHGCRVGCSQKSKENNNDVL